MSYHRRNGYSVLACAADRYAASQRSLSKAIPLYWQQSQRFQSPMFRPPIVRRNIPSGWALNRQEFYGRPCRSYAAPPIRRNAARLDLFLAAAIQTDVARTSVALTPRVHNARIRGPAMDQVDKASAPLV